MGALGLRGRKLVDIETIKIIVRETCNVVENSYAQMQKPREFSKCVIIFASVMFALTWIVGAVSWFMWREFPAELAQLVTALYGVALAIYGAKAGIENHTKIKKDKD